MATEFRKLSGRTQLLTTAPSNPVSGDEYLNPSTNIYWLYDGSVWRGVALGTTTTSTSTSSSTTTTSTSTTTTSTSTTTTSTSTTTTTTSTSTTTTP